jgi:hypothetical protein
MLNGAPASLYQLFTGFALLPIELLLGGGSNNNGSGGDSGGLGGTGF